MKKIYRDAIGEISVPEQALWRAGTERSRHNFPTGPFMPEEILQALIHIKASAAQANYDAGTLTEEKKTWILTACDELSQHFSAYKEQFPLHVYQTGSGTQSNMNVNEVIASLGEKLCEEKTSKKISIHPNDDVNQSQSSNDTFPSSLHMAIHKLYHERLEPVVCLLEKHLEEKVKHFHEEIKVGRTHLQDAVPLRVGDEFSAYLSAVKADRNVLSEGARNLLALALGGTAVGSSLNASAVYRERVYLYLLQRTSYPYRAMSNFFHGLSIMNRIGHFHAGLSTLAMSLFKMANDLRYLASGPRCGLGELILPSNEPGSSIMPGKVNPTQIEALCMVVARIFGNASTVQFIQSQGQFQLNTYLPLLGFTVLESIKLLSEVLESFIDKCLQGIQVNPKKNQENLAKNLMSVTSLVPLIGYDKASQCAKLAQSEDKTLKDVVLELGFASEQEIDACLDPRSMLD